MRFYNTFRYLLTKTPMTPMIPILLFVLATLVALAGLRRVPEDQVVTVHRFGRYVGTLMPGLHWVVPGLDRIACHVPLIGHHLTLPPRSLGVGSAQADVYFQILEPLQSGAELERVDALVARQAGLALEALQASPAQPSSGLGAAAEALKAELNRRCAGQGLRIIRCSLSPNV